MTRPASNFWDQKSRVFGRVLGPCTTQATKEERVRCSSSFWKEEERGWGQKWGKGPALLPTKMMLDAQFVLHVFLGVSFGWGPVSPQKLLKASWQALIADTTGCP
jgi:hypothetical protein